MNLDECLGKAILTIEFGGIFPAEAHVLEKSPSGDYFKIRYVVSGHIAWVTNDQVEVVEVLGKFNRRV
jgi:hypothetical protein